MTRKQMEELVELWQGRLGLGGWQLEVDWSEPAGENNNARIWRSYDYDRATVYFSEDYRKWSKQKAAQSVVHELLHLVARDGDFILRMLDGQLRRDVYAMVESAHEHHTEQWIDRLAHCLVALEF